MRIHKNFHKALLGIGILVGITGCEQPLTGFEAPGEPPENAPFLACTAIAIPGIQVSFPLSEERSYRITIEDSQGRIEELRSYVNPGEDRITYIGAVERPGTYHIRYYSSYRGADELFWFQQAGVEVVQGPCHVTTVRMDYYTTTDGGGR